jgi:hypothetical protein
MILSRILQIFRNTKTSPFFSFLIGLGLSVMLFHKPIHTRSTLALPVAEVEGQVVKYNQKCYKYTAEDSQCEIPSSK